MMTVQTARTLLFSDIRPLKRRQYRNWKHQR